MSDRKAPYQEVIDEVFAKCYANIGLTNDKKLFPLFLSYGCSGIGKTRYAKEFQMWASQIIKDENLLKVVTNPSSKCIYIEFNHNGNRIHNNEINLLCQTSCHNPNVLPSGNTFLGFRILFNYLFENGSSYNLFYNLFISKIIDNQIKLSPESFSPKTIIKNIAMEIQNNNKQIGLTDPFFIQVIVDEMQMTNNIEILHHSENRKEYLSTSILRSMQDLYNASSSPNLFVFPWVTGTMVNTANLVEPSEFTLYPQILQPLSPKGVSEVFFIFNLIYSLYSFIIYIHNLLIRFVSVVFLKKRNKIDISRFSLPASAAFLGD